MRKKLDVVLWCKKPKALQKTHSLHRVICYITIWVGIGYAAEVCNLPFITSCIISKLYNIQGTKITNAITNGNKTVQQNDINWSKQIRGKEVLVLVETDNELLLEVPKGELPPWLLPLPPPWLLPLTPRTLIS